MSAVMQVIQNERGMTGRVGGRIYLYLASLRGTSGRGGKGVLNLTLTTGALLGGTFVCECVAGE